MLEYSSPPVSDLGGGAAEALNQGLSWSPADAKREHSGLAQSAAINTSLAARSLWRTRGA